MKQSPTDALRVLYDGAQKHFELSATGTTAVIAVVVAVLICFLVLYARRTAKKT